MHDDVAIIDYHPALARLPFLLAPPAVFLTDGLQCCLCQGVQHSVAGAGAEHEVVREGSHINQIQQKDILAFLGIKGADYRAGQFKSIQDTPRVVRWFSAHAPEARGGGIGRVRP